MSLLSARPHLDAFGELLGLLARHRQLTWAMTRREISDRYAGQVLGTLWAVGHPLVLMAVYIFIFGYVLRLKIGGTLELPLDYTAYLLAGLIPWMAFQESMAKGATAIVGNANLVKQVVFPVEVLPVKGVLASFSTQLVATAPLAAYVLATHGSLPWTYAAAADAGVLPGAGHDRRGLRPGRRGHVLPRRQGPRPGLLHRRHVPDAGGLSAGHGAEASFAPAFT